MNQEKKKIRGRIVKTKKRWMILIGLMVLALAGGVIGYLVYTGRLNFKADTSSVLSNTIYGTYTSDLGSGNVASNEIQVQVNITP